MSKYAPRYATITIHEINYLMERKAPKNALPVLLVLNAYCMDGHSCFPSIATIKELLNNTLSVRTIQKVLKWLVDNLVIERNSRRSKNRWINLLRKMVYGTKDQNVSEDNNEQNGRFETSKSFAIREEPEQKDLTSVSLLKQGDEKHKPKKSRTVREKLNSAKRRVQRYTNILNNREEPINRHDDNDETRSILSYWMACYKLGQPYFDGTDEQLRDIAKLYHQDNKVRDSLEFYPEITKQIERSTF